MDAAVPGRARAGRRGAAGVRRGRRQHPGGRAGRGRGPPGRPAVAGRRRSARAAGSTWRWALDAVPGLRWPDVPAGPGRWPAGLVRAALPEIDGVRVLAGAARRAGPAAPATVAPAVDAAARGERLVVVDLPRQRRRRRGRGAAAVRRGCCCVGGGRGPGRGRRRPAHGRPRCSAAHRGPARGRARPNVPAGSTADGRGRRPRRCRCGADRCAGRAGRRRRRWSAGEAAALRPARAGGASCAAGSPRPTCWTPW